jgi:hypothetical protein
MSSSAFGSGLRKRYGWVNKFYLVPILIACHSQSYEGALSFATDAWTSPNHRAFVAVTVHLEEKGVPVSILLDIVEVAHSHSGLNLAAAFANILDEFGISDKVSCNCSHQLVDSSHTGSFNYL